MICGLGMDLVDIARIADMLQRHPVRARQRLFLPGERAYCDARAEPARHYAARFAAKEAAYKALAGSAEARHISWHDIEVLSDPRDGRPSLRLHGAAAERAEVMAVRGIHLTLTHSQGVAAATVVLSRA